MSTPTYTATGTKATAPAKLDKSVFGVEVTNHQLLKDAYEAYLANGRVNLARAKTRGEVRGGGRKPWRQKGTGRARFGSSRVPIWRSGGITFGPTGEENYTKRINVKAKRQAIRQALSLAEKNNKIVVIESFNPKGYKTSEANKLLTKLGADRSTLIIVADKTPELTRATNNLPDVKVVNAKYLTVYDVLNASHIVLEKPALNIISEWLGDVKK